MRRKIEYILALLLLLTISACTTTTEISTQAQPTQESSVETTVQEESYPISTPLPVIQNTSYPITEDNEVEILPTSEPLIIPEADPASGIVYGQIYSYTTNEVLPNVKIYLAEKVPLEPGPGYTIAFQEKNSPNAQTNSRGEFLIEEVNPGNYIPIMATPFGIFPLANEETNEIELIVEAGQIYNLGGTSVNWP